MQFIQEARCVPLYGRLEMPIDHQYLLDMIRHQGNMPLAWIEFRNAVRYLSSLVAAHLHRYIRVILPLPEVNGHLEIGQFEAPI